MKRRLNKIIDVLPSTRKNAEVILGRTIDNHLFSDYGYICGKEWFPKEYIDGQSVAYDTDRDRVKFLTNEIRQLSETLPNNKNFTYKRLINEMYNFIKNAEQ